MRKKIAILTLHDYTNYGNRLQNYALSTIIKRYAKNVKSIYKTNSLSTVKEGIKIILGLFLKEYRRRNIFRTFTKKYIPEGSYKSKEIQKVIIGSDQIWNPEEVKNNPLYMSKEILSKNALSYAASFGVSEINQLWYKSLIRENLSKQNINHVSVREDSGKKIIEDLTGRKDVEVLVDPTMLLTAEEWDKISKKPKRLKTKKYILSYFLGNQSESRRKEIEKIAKENNCQIINILDKNDPFYTCGPSEFLYLEKHAFLICTDSFHSSVFAILYNRPFVVFEREQKDIANMNSRLDTLINKFKLKNRRYNGINITNENLNHDYSEAYKILEIERKKSIDFLNKALED